MSKKANQTEELVNINDFAVMAGFPAELIKKELFIDREETESVSMEELRNTMIKYLDSAMALES